MSSPSAGFAAPRHGGGRRWRSPERLRRRPRARAPASPAKPRMRSRPSPTTPFLSYYLCHAVDEASRRFDHLPGIVRSDNDPGADGIVGDLLQRVATGKKSGELTFDARLGLAQPGNHRTQPRVALGDPAVRDKTRACAA